MKVLFVILLTGFNFLVFGQTVQHDLHCCVIKTENSQQFEQWLATITMLKQATSDEVYQFPVVVHVLYNGEKIGEGTNISDEQILSQLRVINEDFRRKEGTRGFNTHPDGGDARIEFVMAKSTPEGEATNGIVRIDINSKEPPPFGGNMIAFGAYYSIWDPNRYLNIWSVPGILDTGLGEARFPLSDLPGLQENEEIIIPGFDSLNGIPVNQIDGVAINVLHFGETNLNSVYNLGRTGTHEIGHFLGLFHTWGDQGFEGSCDIDDYCDDTPLTDSRTSGCPQNRMSCDSHRVMIENYMDYTDDACMNIFTNDQIFRMRTVLENSPRRNSLLFSTGLLPPDEVNGISMPTPSSIRIINNTERNYIIIEFPEIMNQMIELHFFDMSGKRISSQTVFTHRRRAQVPIPGGHQAVLFLQIVSDREITMKKIVVNH